ncbi:MAG: hypothetical protein QOC83_1272, partial [Pseudonocardiales bacterium]|nr:hypothetical protein [Pseudonocardiales bacterium]
GNARPARLMTPPPHLSSLLTLAAPRVDVGQEPGRRLDERRTRSAQTGLAARRRRPPRPAQRNSHRRRRLPGPRRTLSRNDASLIIAGPPQPVAARAGGVLWAGARDVTDERASGLTHENCRRSNICSTHGVDGGALADGPEDCSAAEGVAAGHEAAAAPEQLAPGGAAGRPPGSPTVRECATERPLGSESRGAVAATVTADCRERPSSHSPGQPPKCLTSPSIPAA